MIREWVRVSTGGLQQIFFQQPGEKVYWENEDFMNFPQ